METALYLLTFVISILAIALCVVIEYSLLPITKALREIIGILNEISDKFKSN